MNCVRALYDYEPQNPDELSLTPSSILIVQSSQGEWLTALDYATGVVGLIPNNYIEPCPILYEATSLYSYQGRTKEELSVEEENAVEVYADSDSDWWLIRHNDMFGLFPSSYLQKKESKDVLLKEALESSTYTGDPLQDYAQNNVGPEVPYWSLYEKKSKRGMIGIGEGYVWIVTESKAILQKHTLKDVLKTSSKGKHVFLDVIGQQTLDYKVGSIAEAETVVKEIILARKQQVLSGMDSIKKSQSLTVIANVEKKRHAVVLYEFQGTEGDELNVREGEQVEIVEFDAEWTRVMTESGKNGLVPTSYIEELTVEGKRKDVSTPGTPTQARASYFQQEIASPVKVASSLEAIVEPKSLPVVVPTPSIETLPLRRESLKSVDSSLKAIETETLAIESKPLPSLDKPSTPSSPVKPPSPPSKPALPPHPTHRTSKLPPPPPSSPPLHAPPTLPKNLRTWSDRSASFKVEAEFLGVSEGKVHLHKVNGVKIAVPLEKLSDGDQLFVREAIGEKSGLVVKSAVMESKVAVGVMNEQQKDIPSVASVPKVVEMKPLHVKSTVQALPLPLADVPQLPPRPTTFNNFNWHQFFVECGVMSSDASTYAEIFVKERMDETVVDALDRAVLKELGLKEGDIMKTMKKVSSRKEKLRKVEPAVVPQPAFDKKLQENEERAKQKNLERLEEYFTSRMNVKDGVDDQIRRDEEMARKLQEEENRTNGNTFKSSSAPWKVVDKKSSQPQVQKKKQEEEKTWKQKYPDSIPAVPQRDPLSLGLDKLSQMQSKPQNTRLPPPLIPTPVHINVYPPQNSRTIMSPIINGMMQTQYVPNGGNGMANLMSANLSNMPPNFNQQRHTSISSPSYTGPSAMNPMPMHNSNSASSLSSMAGPMAQQGNIPPMNLQSNAIPPLNNFNANLNSTGNANNPNYSAMNQPMPGFNNNIPSAFNPSLNSSIGTMPNPMNLTQMNNFSNNNSTSLNYSSQPNNFSKGINVSTMNNMQMNSAPMHRPMQSNNYSMPMNAGNMMPPSLGMNSVGMQSLSHSTMLNSMSNQSFNPSNSTFSSQMNNMHASMQMRLPMNQNFSQPPMNQNYQQPPPMNQSFQPQQQQFQNFRPPTNQNTAFPNNQAFNGNIPGNMIPNAQGFVNPQMNVNIQNFDKYSALKQTDPNAPNIFQQRRM